MMEMRQYKKTEEQVSLLGFGCMRLPLVDPKQQDIDYPKAMEMIDYAMEHGVNYYDTAYPYHERKSEPFIGEALKKYPRERFNLASKLPMWLVDSKEKALALFEEQLESCQVEYFDYYLAHNLNQSYYGILKEHDVYAVLAELKKRGKIRRLGFSFHDQPALLQEIVNEYEWDFAQIQLNYLDWYLQDAEGQYNILTEKGIPVVIMEPVRGGTLATLSDEAVTILKDYNPDASAASWAIRYAASLPNVITVLSGMSTLEQVVDNVNATENFKPLTEEERGVLQKALDAFRRSATIPCTSCRYCMDCPSGVDIPRVFGFYNAFMLTKSNFGFYSNYKLLGEDHQAHQCTECGVCMERCPQGIKIPELMGTVTEAYKKAEIAANQ